MLAQYYVSVEREPSVKPNATNWAACPDVMSTCTARPRTPRNVRKISPLCRSNRAGPSKYRPVLPTRSVRTRPLAQAGIRGTTDRFALCA